MTGDNDYSATVYADPVWDEQATDLVRALHAELCREPHGDHYGACARAASVPRRWFAERSSSAPGQDVAS